MHRSPFDPTDLRRRAERSLRDRDLPSKAQLDPIRLLHELQVHQVELEIQNENLVDSNQDLDALRMKYQLLYESAPVAYLTLSGTGHVVECNTRALQMLALGYDAVLKRPLRNCFEPSSLGTFDALLAEASLDGAAGTAKELLLRRPKRLPMYVRAQARTLQLPHHDTTLYLFVMMDVSTLKFALDDIARVIQNDPGVPPN